ncbi:MAG: cyclic nucleotide-binding domain-containing protein [Desulfobacteraceae bacterium]|nr:cyclic nucleotide-binding domain-containing protein [Desulfobacteraceae bacterium]MBC2756048.1 cyclic nucleotide-binding domain-containing protein [Desulfobacteraceae bacterium]
MITLKELDSVQAFKTLTDDQLEALKEFCIKKDFKRGDRLFKEGDSAGHLWIVTEGKVDLRFELPGNQPTSDETTISSLEAEDDKKRTLGWSCFVPPFKMMLSAYCVTRSCSVIKIAKTDMLALFEKDALMGYQVMSYLIKVIGYRFQQFQDELAKYKGHDIMHSW